MQEEGFPDVGNLVSIHSWARSLGRDRITIWRWRKQYPWLQTINVFGKVYIHRDVIAEFERRAAAGEFEKTIVPVVASKEEAVLS